MNPEHIPFRNVTKRSRLNKSINTLLGILQGISIDGVVNDRERHYLNDWLESHTNVADIHPYNELIPLLDRALEDNVLDEEERADVNWLCDRVMSTDYYDVTTASMQRLHAILGGITSDGHVNELEIRGLSEWLEEHSYLKSCWPFDEVDSIVTAVLMDNRVDDDEREMLFRFFSEFLPDNEIQTIASPIAFVGETITAVCASCPEVRFTNAKFCFTGASSKFKRTELAEIVTSLGGTTTKSVTQDTDYLIVGADGNPAWAYACYGRKVEKAIELRRNGASLMIVHEFDFHDAVADQR